MADELMQEMLDRIKERETAYSRYGGTLGLQSVQEWLMCVNEGIGVLTRFKKSLEYHEEYLGCDEAL